MGDSVYGANTGDHNSTDTPGPITGLLSRIVEWGGAKLLGTPQNGALSVHFPNGRSRTLGDPRSGVHAELIFKNFRVLPRSMRRGTVGFAASYIKGDIESPDLTALFLFFLRNLENFSNPASALFHRATKDLKFHLKNANSRAGSKRNIAEHYDLGNDFYAQWLDSSMTYSSAVFEHETLSLEQAQMKKYHQIAQMAGVKPGNSVLEIGCGWGGLAEVLARDYDASVYGITLSGEQLRYARNRMEKAGLDKKANLVFEDYRDTGGEFDHVCSIEMIEAVGEEHWPRYFSTLYDRLKPGGTAAVQAITIDEAHFDSYRAGPDFIQRYIFPGGMLMTKSAMYEQGEKAGLVLENTKNFGHSYAKTLALWRKKFLDRWPAIAPLGYDEAFKRKWLYYLSYCEAGFSEDFIDVGIYQYRRPKS
ncbi:MAG TPA: class I SAM-dependent methyltransferase [Devosia sp.]|nr:class I SAM-dependent methyltransferase [Devosia sp.]